MNAYFRSVCLSIQRRSQDLFITRVVSIMKAFRFLNRSSGEKSNKIQLFQLVRVALRSLSRSLSVSSRYDRFWFDRSRGDYRFQSTRSKQTHIYLLVIDPLRNESISPWPFRLLLGFVRVSLLKDSSSHYWQLLQCITPLKIALIHTRPNMERDHRCIILIRMIKNNLAQ